MKLYDAPRCPYCARVRIVLAEKGVAYESVEVDLSHRPPWIYDLNPTGRVPVLEIADEGGGFVLPESDVIMGYLEQRYRSPALLPRGLADRARANLLVRRFDDNLGDDYYAFRRGDPNDLLAKLDVLELGQSLYADIAYAPWVIRARDRMRVHLPDRIATWLRDLEQRPSIAAEVAVVASL